MTPIRSLVVVPILLIAVSLEAGDIAPAGEMAEGALSFLISKRCERSPTLDAKGVEWPALVYSRGKPPAWGRKLAGECRGLDTWVLSEALAAGVYWGQTDHKTIEADPNNTLFDPEKGHAAFKKAFGWELPE